MLTITKLKSAEYLIASVADGMEDYYTGAGEAPGVCQGRWAAALGLEGVVEGEALRALVNGVDPDYGAELLAGRRERTVRAIDVTLSVPKSVSLLWAFGTPETSAVVSIAVVEGTETALEFLEERAAVARRQEGGIRRRVGTDGFAVATFAHRTSRAGDPQLHTHCLIPNVVRRHDGACVALDANPLHTWAKATGTVFLNELERLLTERLGVAWGPERNGCRELVGFTREQLRAFSKRTVAIETRLEANGELAFGTRRERMRADDRASLATRAREDKTLTPERLRNRWHAEAEAVGLHTGAAVDDLVIGRNVAARLVLDDAGVFAALTDPQAGLCATDSRFCDAHVVERVAAISGGRLRVDEVVAMSRRFLASELVVRLAPGDRRRPPEWSTREHRAVEDHVLATLQLLIATPGRCVDDALIGQAIAATAKPLGADQADAVRVLCGDGASVRVFAAPAGFGKTTALQAAAQAQRAAGRDVVVLATTHKAVGELRSAGLDAQTTARFLTHVRDEPARAGTTVIVDEVSQLGTRQAAALLDIVARALDAQLWCVGDAHQAQPVAAGGLFTELARATAHQLIPVATLTHNRRQGDPAEREALARLRKGDVAASQQIRAAHRWEHEYDTVDETRDALAAAAVADADHHGLDHVAVLAVSHADCEDLADRIRTLRTARGELRGPTMSGPGWGLQPRIYAAGDRILVHANLAPRSERGIHNGATGIVLSVSSGGAQVRFDDSRHVFLPAEFISGSRPDGTPNISHAWARTIDGAQGGTWAHVHLLGTPALDHHTGYVGQSRGRQPTHTWNTGPEPDHPTRLLADQRTPSQVVADALRRAEPKTFAATDDPSTLDRHPRHEREHHANIILGRPPDPRRDLDDSHQRLAGSEDEYESARGTRLSRGRTGASGPAHPVAAWWTRRHRPGRRSRRLCRASPRPYEQRTRTGARRSRPLHSRGGRPRPVGPRASWRVDRVAELDDTLAHHWADIVLRVVRADDPLAFGVQRLRHARTTYILDHQRLLDALPPDRHRAIARAQADHERCQQRVRDAAQHVRSAQLAVEQARPPRWRQRDTTDAPPRGN